VAEDKKITIGIDLGTTYSCAAWVQDGKPRIVPSEKGYTTVPSVVGISKKNDIIVGHPALDQLVTKPENAIYGSKRLIGRSFNSMIVQKMVKEMTYQIVPGRDNSASVVLGGTNYTLTEISSFILSEIKEMSQGQLQVEIHEAVITVPAYYNDNQRSAVKRAGEMAGFLVKRIVNEPTAAAVAYGFNKGFDQKVLVYDFGGGTFDVSILHIHGNKFKVLATGGDTFLGGSDFDTRITDYVLQSFRESAQKDLLEEKIAVQRIRAAAERAKRDLSTEKSVKIELPYITEIKGEPTDLKFSLTREKLNSLTVDLVDKTFSICDQVLNSVGIRHSDLNEILLVGGQTRMPLVQNKIHQFFKQPPRKGVHPDEVVALGAAILSDPMALTGKVQLHDVLSMPIGIGLPTGSFKRILDKNIPVPASKSFKIGLKKGLSLDIDIFQGEKSTVAENEYLGTFSFPTPLSGQKVQRLEVKFDLSPECLLSVRSRDMDTGQETKGNMVTLHSPESVRVSASGGKADGAKKSGWLSNLSSKFSRK